MTFGRVFVDAVILCGTNCDVKNCGKMECLAVGLGLV